MSSIIKKGVISVVSLSVIEMLESIFGELPLELKLIMYFVPLCVMIDGVISNYQARQANGLRPEDTRELEAMTPLEERKESQSSLEDEEDMQEGDE